MDLRLPDALAAKTMRFPESSYGATTVTLLLVDGRRVPHVVVAGDEIAKVGGRTITSADQLGFDMADVEDVVAEPVGCLRSAFLAVRSLTRRSRRRAKD